jgi:hypothetical protein
MDNTDFGILFGVLTVIALVTVGLDITVWRP